MIEPVLNAPSFEFYEFFPKDFFVSKKRESEKGYEKFTKFVMEQLLPTGEWTRGDATKKEPDYLYNNIPFEFTLASDKKKIIKILFSN